MPQPNIIFMLADDLGWRDLSCYGSTFYETPNLDRLAARGTMFTDAYAACPVCSPTRASILSGKYPANVGVTDWIACTGSFHPCRGRLIDAPYVDHLPAEEVSLARALRAGGYQTWHVGKWHLGGPQWYPREHGFDVNVGGCEFGSPRKSYFAPWSIPVLPGDVEPGTFLDDYLTDEAVRLIGQRDPLRPFFLNFWFYLVHTPLQAKAELIEKYTRKAQALGLDQVNAVEEGELFPTAHKRHLRVQRRRLQSHAVYAAMIEIMDANIGRLLKAVEDAGQLDNTIVVFTSDNGGLSTAEGSPTCNAPLAEGKGWMYDGGTREPLICAGPGVTPAGLCRTPVSSPDFYPTFLDLAGLPRRPDQHADGVSFASLLRRPDTTLDREALYWHYPHYGNQGGTPGSSIRMGDWKLIEFFEDRRLELYHLTDDISETRNRAGAESGRVKQMHGLLKAWRDRVGARMPVPNPDWRPTGDAAPTV